MTTREHLIHHLQEFRTFQRDMLPLLDRLHHTCGEEELGTLLETAREGMRAEMETLEQVLHLLGARHTLEHSALAMGWRESLARFQHAQAPSQEQQDIHTALLLLALVQFSLGAYQGEVALARALGEPDVALLLDESALRQRELLRTLRPFIDRYMREISRREARRAA